MTLNYRFKTSSPGSKVPHDQINCLIFDHCPHRWSLIEMVVLNLMAKGVVQCDVAIDRNAHRDELPPSTFPMLI